MSTILTLFVGLSHIPHTCKHVQCAQYMQTHPAATALYTVTNKQRNLTLPPPLGDTCPHAKPIPSGQKISRGSGSIS